MAFGTTGIEHRLEKKIANRERLNAQDGQFLLTQAPLLWLGRMAQEIRNQKNPLTEVSFILDSNPNYTNVCDTNCQFCAFFRRPHHAEAYTLTVDEVLGKIDRVQKMGATTILLQGGHNKELSLEYYTDLVRRTRERFPSVTPHFFSASEIHTMAEVSGKGLAEVLTVLDEAGQHTLPGGGAEILSDPVREKLAPKKGGKKAWGEVHRLAHELGWASTATMMYGHVETASDVTTHWDYIRELQDEAIKRKNKGGFTAFIPWSFKPDNTVLQRRFPRRTGPVPYLRMLAASRIYLDNFNHIQASWFSEGKKTGQTALHFGCDDFGGILYDENVHAEAGYVQTTTQDDMISLIHEAGFDAVQRTTRYEKLRVFKRSEGIPAGVTEETSFRKNILVASPRS